MKILQIVHDFPPHSYSGTELYTLNLSKRLMNRGHSVSVLYPIFDRTRPSFSFTPSEFENVPVFTFNQYDLHERACSDHYNPQFDTPFQQFLERNAFDIIHIQHLLTLSSSWVKIAKDSGAKVVMKLDDMFFYCPTIHLVDYTHKYCQGPDDLDKCAKCVFGVEEKDTDFKRLAVSERNRRLREAFALPQFIHSPSQFIIDGCTKYDIINKNLTVIRTGIAPFDLLPKKNNGDTKVVAFMGVIAFRKGILDFVAAAEIFHKIHLKNNHSVHLRFEMFGTHFNDDVYKYMLGKVEQNPFLNYQGKFIPEDRARIFSGIDALVVPSLGENYPFIIREALYAGVPVVATHIAGIPEIIQHNVNGLLYPPGDIMELAKIFESINADTKLLGRLEPSKTELVFTDTETEQIENIYNQLLSSEKLSLDFLKTPKEESKVSGARPEDSQQYVQLINLGEQAFASGQKEDARTYFEEAITLCPKEPMAYNNLGVYYWDEGKQDNAKLCFEKAIDNDPRFKSAVINIFEFFQDKKQIHHFVSIGRAYLKLEPNDKEVGRCLEKAQAAYILENAKKKDKKRSQTQAYISTPNPIKVSIVIPCFNQVDFTKLCIEYLPKSDIKTSYELIVVDNGSTDLTRKYLGSIKAPIKKIQNATNLGFAKGCNQGAESARGEVLVFLNNDIIPMRGWLENMLDDLALPDTGIVGPKLVYPNNVIQHAGVTFFFSKLPFHIYQGCDANAPFVNTAREFNAITGACLMISRALFYNVGGFDESFINGLEDIDLCLKVRRKNLAVRYQPKSELWHFESRTAKRQDHMSHNQKLFLERWAESIEEDAYKNLMRDNMVIGVSHETKDFIYLSKAEFDASMEKDARPGQILLEEGKTLKAYNFYSGLVNKFPYYKKGLEIIKQLAPSFNQTLAAQKSTERLEHIIRFMD